jgi:uncharacterized protein YjiS (DUF1127 family)
MSQSSALEPRPNSGAKTGRRMLSSLAHTIGTWLVRRDGRQELRSLDDRLLKDIGISREDAGKADKPFWKP